MEELLSIPKGLTTNGLIARRYMARMVDSIAIGMVGSLVGVLAGAVMGSTVSPVRIVAVFTIAATIYGGLLESSKWQAKAIHDRVVGSFVAAEDQTTSLNLSASA